MLARLLRRAMRVLLRANTGPVDALVYFFALCWLAFLAFTPDRAFAHTAAHNVLQYKGIWVWPALAQALVTPVGWMSDRARVHHAARIYAAAWWAYLTTATAYAAPSILVFWATAFGCLVSAVWLMAREWAYDIPVAPEG